MSLKMLITATVIISLFLSSCQKEKVTTVVKDKPVSIVNSAASIQQIINRTEMIFAVLNNGNLSFKNEITNSILSCATISTDSSAMPRVTVIDYGTGCVGDDGITRKGKVVIAFDGDYREAGVSVITTFSHYYENDDQITGSDTLRNIGLNGSGNVTLSFSQNYDILLANNGGTEKIVFTGTREWLTGVSTETIDDDQYGLNLTGYVTIPNEPLRTFTSTTPIIFDKTPGCSAFAVKGTVLCHPASGFDFIFDYGSGTCDDLVDVTENGITTTYSMVP